jgi:3-deoxy-7-phosphoheptulonate synthase
MIDPSHGTGWSEYVPSMSLASIAAGVDSLMIEVHPNPKRALSDGPQSLTFEAFDKLMFQINRMAQVMERG